MNAAAAEAAEAAARLSTKPNETPTAAAEAAEAAARLSTKPDETPTAAETHKETP